MRAVVQRVKKGRITVDGQTIGQIDKGIVLFLGVGKDDGEDDLQYTLEKVLNLRIFEDENGKMNRSLIDVGGELLVVSQFTLYGDCRKGRRPSFTDAAPPDHAESFYERFVALARERGIPTKTGRFAAMMDVELVNHGPVTMMIDSRKTF